MEILPPQDPHYKKDKAVFTENLNFGIRYKFFERQVSIITELFRRDEASKSMILKTIIL